MTDATRQRIRECRRQIERATTEANRWGMVLNAATELRSGVRRGRTDADGTTVNSRFERLLRGAPAESTADRRQHLAYLSTATIEGGPADGSTFFGFATGQSGQLGSFAAAFQSFVDGDAGAPDVAALRQRFEADVVDAARAGGADSAALEGLVQVVEAGLRAATAHRDAAIDDLNDTYEDGSRTDRGLVHQFHEAGTLQGDGDTGSEEDDGPDSATGERGTDATDGPTGTGAAAGYVDLVTDLEERPVAMLPVGVQTRFVDDGDHRFDEDPTAAGDELWIRVYPDDIHVDEHDPELTPQEERWGKTFWTQLYVARHPQARTVSADQLPRAPLGGGRLVHRGVLPDGRLSSRRGRSRCGRRTPRLGTRAGGGRRPRARRCRRGPRRRGAPRRRRR